MNGTRSFSGGLLLFLILGLTVEIGVGWAQQIQASTDATISCFEESRRTGTMSQCDRGVVALETMLHEPGRFEPSTIEAVLDGLERLAIESDAQMVRLAAAAYLAVPGTALTGTGRPLPGIVGRMESVYRRSDDLAVRTKLTKSMYDQAESAQAIAFLVDVAQEDKPADRSVTWPPAREAVQVLARMGPLGGAALESLHAGGKVKNPRARGYLEYLSEHSFHDPQ